MINFNPHSHAGSDIRWLTLALLPPCISIHTPTQGVPDILPSTAIIGKNFNPHSHAGSDGVKHCHPHRFRNFNPHSHAGSDAAPPAFSVPYAISIHTPTQGVTFHHASRILSFFISIHTPTQGVTLPVYTIIGNVLDFNPHSHAGSDWKKSR